MLLATHRQPRSSVANLGSRHRAAIGLTEENDAVAVVVSEERGQIALAIHGRLERDLTANQLRDRLQSLIRPRRSHRAAAAQVFEQKRQTIRSAIWACKGARISPWRPCLNFYRRRRARRRAEPPCAFGGAQPVSPALGDLRPPARAC